MKCSINDTGKRLRTMSSAICLAAAFALPAQGETLDTKVGKLDFEAGYPTPEAVMVGWMDSTGHRENILRPSFRRLGIGVHDNGTIWWTQVFFTP